MTVSTWSVIVPVKRAGNAKTRLADAYGGWRPHLARAFALDTIRAASECSRTRSLTVVTDDPELGGIVDAWAHVCVLEDRGQGGVNAAIRIGLCSLEPANRVAVITSDLPALTGAALDVALDRAAEHDVAVVADHERTGTTVLAASSPRLLRPRFGHDSLRLHVEDGAAELDMGEASRIRRDVDLPAHLSAAIALGVGPATEQVLQDLGNGTGPATDPAPQA